MDFEAPERRAMLAGWLADALSFGDRLDMG